MNKIRKLYRFIRICVLRMLVFVTGKVLVVDVKSVLIVAPHPDDEVFGCAGLIQRLLSNRVEVSVLILTRGENSSFDEDVRTIQKARTLLAEEVVSLLEVQHLYWGDFEDGNLRSADLSGLQELIKQINPDTVFVPHCLEGWSDHEATESKFRDLLRTMDLHCKVFHYCVWFWFSMSYSKSWQVKWKHAFLLKMDEEEHQRKLQAINVYFSKVSEVTGKPYSGMLPEEFLFANRWNKELFFEVK